MYRRLARRFSMSSGLNVEHSETSIHCANKCTWPSRVPSSGSAWCLAGPNEASGRTLPRPSRPNGRTGSNRNLAEDLPSERWAMGLPNSLIRAVPSLSESLNRRHGMIRRCFAHERLRDRLRGWNIYGVVHYTVHALLSPEPERGAVLRNI